MFYTPRIVGMSQSGHMVVIFLQAIICNYDYSNDLRHSQKGRFSPSENVDAS
jgi:hypothetical protein